MHKDGKFPIFSRSFVILCCCAQISCSSEHILTSAEVNNNQFSLDYGSQLYDLRMAALKGFKGEIFYVGSNSDYDYFKIEKFGNKYFRVIRHKVKLEARYAIGNKIPYKVGFDELIRKSNL